MRTSNTLNAPPQTQTSATNNPQLRNKQLKILQINVNGIQNKTVELQQLLTQENIDILTIQEAKLNSTNKTPQFPHYSAIRKDRTSKSGGGLHTYVKDNITFTDAPPPPTTSTNLIETQAIKINISTNQTLTISNNYVPPRNPSTNTQSEDDAITDLLTHLTDTPNSVITVDFNAHSNLWHSQITDHRGDHIASIIQSSTHSILNRNSHTHIIQPTHSTQ